MFCNKTIFILAFYLTLFTNTSAEIFYEISFLNAVHHEAEVQVSISAIKEKILKVRMSRSSPGRYALHEFAKNIYAIKAFDDEGNALKITKYDPYEWHVVGHKGNIKITYTLFADRADGTYSAIDETHAHLNPPATFMYFPDHQKESIKIKFNLRDDLNWKVATQLKELSATEFWAPNLQYFFDSPVELSNFSFESWNIEASGKTSTFILAVHHLGTDNEVKKMAEDIKKIVNEERKVFGELPDFDFGTYTIIACYLPHVEGDGMEHRNSTICTSKGSLATNYDGLIGTVAHEMFHAWNVERLRPASLEPFDFSKANMSGELWFAEGFTNYYGHLMLSRAGIISQAQLIRNLEWVTNLVTLWPGRNYHNPIQMSQMAPFVDAATFNDPINYSNTHISYYYYGQYLALCLDLMIRKEFAGKSLDTYMAALWKIYGKQEKPYTLQNLQEVLSKTTSIKFASKFFDQYIFKSDLPPIENYLLHFGLELKKQRSPLVSLVPTFGKTFDFSQGEAKIITASLKGSSLYEADLEKGDVIHSVNGKVIRAEQTLDSVLNSHKPGDQLSIDYLQRGIKKQTILTIQDHYWLVLFDLEDKLPKDVADRRRKWLLNE